MVWQRNNDSLHYLEQYQEKQLHFLIEGIHAGADDRHALPLCTSYV